MNSKKLELDVLVDVDAKKPQQVKGLVLGRSNRGVDSSVTLICKVMGTPVRRKIPLYSPLVRGMRVLQKAYVNKGKKKVKN